MARGVHATPIATLALAAALLASATAVALAASAARAVALVPSAVASAAAPPVVARVVPDTTVTTILLVRHAEKDTVLLGPDPPLRAAGRLRAQALAHAVGDAGIAAIYVTPWLRNRQTAMPLATVLGETLTVVNAVAETVQRLRARHWGETVLVVGHSNTIPDIVARLTGRPFPTPEHVAYDGMWVVMLGRDGRASLVTLRYGAPDDVRPEPLPPRTP